MRISQHHLRKHTAAAPPPTATATACVAATGAGNAVIRMDATGRQTLIDWLDAISAGTSGANYDAAFQSAFDALLRLIRTTGRLSESHIVHV